MPYNTVVFDFDCTLTFSHAFYLEYKELNPGTFKWYNDVMELGITHDELLQVQYFLKKKLVPKVEEKDISQEEQDRLDFIKYNANPKNNKEEDLKYKVNSKEEEENVKNNIRTVLFGNSERFNYIVNMLQELSNNNIKIYIMSNGMFDSIIYILELVGLDKYIKPNMVYANGNPQNSLKFILIKGLIKKGDTVLYIDDSNDQDLSFNIQVLDGMKKGDISLNSSQDYDIPYNMDSYHKYNAAYKYYGLSQGLIKDGNGLNKQQCDEIIELAIGSSASSSSVSGGSYREQYKYYKRKYISLKNNSMTR